MFPGTAADMLTSLLGLALILLATLACWFIDARTREEMARYIEMVRG